MLGTCTCTSTTGRNLQEEEEEEKGGGGGGGVRRSGSAPFNTMWHMTRRFGKSTSLTTFPLESPYQLLAMFSWTGGHGIKPFCALITETCDPHPKQLWKDSKGSQPRQALPSAVLSAQVSQPKGSGKIARAFSPGLSEKSTDD